MKSFVLSALLAFRQASAGSQCCWGAYGTSDTCGDFPSGGSGGLCNTDWTQSCNGNSDCPDTPAPTPPAPPAPTPTPTPPAPPAPTPTPTPPAPPAPTPSPTTDGKCCWSKWGDASSCGGYPASGSGALCSNDVAHACTGDGDCHGLAPGPPPPPPSLTPNKQGQAQEIKAQVCGGRSSSCSVLLDVPEACAGETSNCPIGFFFHGHTGNNKGFPFSGAGRGAHQYNFIGVYPQGEMYSGQSGWNDGSMHGNLCAWDDFDCQEDPNDGLFVQGILSSLRGMGANGRVYLWGGSNGGNEAQILAANAGADLPIAGISAGWNQLMSAPLRSGPSPYNFNQPAAPSSDPERPGDGRPIAQQAHHGDADTTIPYDGGPRMGGKVFILYPEPESDEVWKNHNGCTGNLSSSEVPATYRDHTTRQQVQTTAVKWVWGGCPTTAPVEYYQVKGAPHGGADTIDGKDAFDIVFRFWSRVEDAHDAATVV